MTAFFFWLDPRVSKGKKAISLSKAHLHFSFSIYLQILVKIFSQKCCGWDCRCSRNQPCSQVWRAQCITFCEKNHGIIQEMSYIYTSQYHHHLLVSGSIRIIGYYCDDPRNMNIDMSRPKLAEKKNAIVAKHRHTWST